MPHRESVGREPFDLRDFYQQQSDEREASRKRFLATVAGQVVSMQERESEYADLLGEIIATLSIPQNRENIRNGIGIDAFFAMADRWKARRDRIAER